ncbi:MAG: MFS transporter [Acidobacteriota bacterium]
MVEKLKKSLLYTYGIADLGFVLMVNMEVYFFPAFLTDYALFPVSLAGKVLLITSSIDILFALVAGVLLHKWTLKFGGKYRSWFLVGPPIVAVLFLLQFTKIGSNSFAAVVIIFGFISSHLIWNIVVTAGGSMVGRLSRLPEERTILSTSRAQGISAAGLIFSVTVVPIITAHTEDISVFTTTVGGLNIMMVLGYWYIFGMTAGKDPYDEANSDISREKSDLSVWEMIMLTLTNPPLILLIFAEIFRNSYVLIITALAHYYFESVLNELTFMSIFILAISVARLTGTVGASWIGIKIGKRNAYWISLLLAAAGFGSALFWSGNAWSFTIVFCIASFLGMIAGAMSTALFSDAVIYGEWKTGKNIRAFTMALQSFAIKVAVFIRNLVVWISLTAIGYVATAEPTSDIVEGIRAITIFSPAVVCIISAAIFFFGYKIEDSTS